MGFKVIGCILDLITLFCTMVLMLYLLFYVLIYLRRKSWNRRRNRKSLYWTKMMTTVEMKKAMFQRLALATTFKTVSYKCDNLAKEEVVKMHEFLKRSFPKVHSSPIVELTVINDLSLLYHVKGSREPLQPYMLCAHLDVLPDEDSPWEFVPFEGVIADGFIWGSGTVTGKHMVMGILEALERLLTVNYEFRRSFYIAFSHDKESGGQKGAHAIAHHLRSREVELEYILDEGTCIVHDIAPEILSPVALIGVTEKGEMNIELSVRGESRHSAISSDENPIVTLSKALAKLNSNIFREKYGNVETVLFKKLSNHVSFPIFTIYEDILRIFPLIMSRLFRDSSLSATYRTTSEAKYICGGTENNEASALAQVNFKIHPKESATKVFRHVKSVINDTKVIMKKLHVRGPQRISPIDSFGYRAIENVINVIFEPCCTVPVTNVSITDTKWYSTLSKCIYRFNPVHQTEAEGLVTHHSNEKISQSNYMEVFAFYIHLIKFSNQ